MESLDAAFRALADPHRRSLLDALRDADGQTLGELERTLPGMTRFGVMKHLRVLEAAGLVATRRAGRRKLHYLNPVPIRLIADRWISRYAAPLVDRMADVKHSVEATTPMTTAAPPKHVYEIYIQAPPERVWQALTDPELTRQYYYGTGVHSEWKAGSAYRYTGDDGEGDSIVGEIVEIDPPRRLVQTFSFPSAPDDAPSRVTWTLEPRGGATLLTLVHDEFESETSTYRSVEHGWVPILSGLKTLLETGRPLVIEYPGVEGVRG